MPISTDALDGADMREVDGAGATTPGADNAMGVADWRQMHPA